MFSKCSNRLTPLVFAIGFFFFITGCQTTAKEKNEADLHLRIGTSYLQRGNNPMAMAELLTAEKLDSGNIYIQNNLGLAYFLNEHYEESLDHFNRALKISSKFSEARNNKARVLI